MGEMNFTIGHGHGILVQIFQFFPSKTDFKLMVAQQSGKGPNLKVVKWW